MKKVYFLIPHLAIITILLFLRQQLYAQTPFSCTDGISYQVRGNPSALYTINLRTGAATPLFSAGVLGNRNLTGLGYNVNDNFIYASISGTNDIVRIGSNGVTTLIDVPGLPALAYTAGDVSPDGILYLYVASSTTIQKVTLSTLAVSSIALGTGANLQDISISPDGTRIYGISNGTGSLVSYAITGGAITSTAVGITAISASSFMDETGDLFVISDGSSSVYEVSGPSFPNSSSISRITPDLSTAISNTDGARCVTSLAMTQPAFSCTPNQAFVSITPGAGLVANDCVITEDQTVLSEYNLATGSVVSTSGQLIQTFGTAPRTNLNNLGYNPTDNYLWAYRFGTNQLVRIGQDRSVDFFAIPGLSTNCLFPEAGTIDNTIFFSGDVRADGVMYLLDGVRGDRFVRVDLNPASSTYLTRLSDVVLTSISPGAGTLSPIQDLAFNPVDGLLYTISANDNLIRINPLSGVVTNLGAVTGIPSSATAYVVAYFDNAGTLYVQKSNNTDIIKVPNVAAGSLSGSVYGTGATFAGGDGARCPYTAIAPLLYSLSGNVFDDGNGLNDAGGALVNTFGAGAFNPVNGASSLGTQLYVTLVSSVGNPLATVPVSATGTYSFPDLAPGTYSTVLSIIPGGTTVANSPLPADWDNTGEQVGVSPGSTDGTPNGIVTGIVITSTDVFNANFGINKKPVVANGIDTSRPNPGGAVQSPVTSTLFAGTDLEDGSYTTPANAANNNLKGRRVNLEPGTNGDVYYDGTIVSAGDPPILDFDPALVSVDPVGTNNQDGVTVTFTYTVTDDAGIVSDPKTIQVPFIANPLPVTLIMFTANKTEYSTVMLNWATTVETNSEKFEVQHSGDGRAWNLITTLAAKGESTALVNYTYSHTTPSAGENLYRLKMIDQDKTFAYSRIQSVQFGETNQPILVYPNPVSNVLYLKDVHLNKLKEVTLIDASGQTVIKSSSVTDKGIIVNYLNPGLYTLKVTNADGTLSTHKVVIVK